jgi:hypothetical protein
MAAQNGSGSTRTRSLAARPRATLARRVGNEHMQQLLRQRGQTLRDRIEQLARDPGLAHEAWKRLHSDDRVAVLHRMRQLFGDKFADEFLAAATADKAHTDIIYWPAGTGPTDEQLRGLGYRRGGLEITGSAWIEVEVWVHPTGKTLRRGLAGQSMSAAPDDNAPPLTADQERALAAMERLQEANDRVVDECSSESFQESAAEDAMSDFMTARNVLRILRRDVDLSAIDPNFWQQFEREEENNALGRAPCCQRNPDNSYFRCPIDRIEPRWPRRP